MNIRDLITNLAVNKEPVAHFPRELTAGPLVIDTKTLEAIESGKMQGEKLCGWKGDVLWTTGAMLWLASKEIL